MCQYWAERRRHILVIVPASLRKQWEIELSDKFNLDSIVLDAKTWKKHQENGTNNPFDKSHIIICSMHYASGRADNIKAIPWDDDLLDKLIEDQEDQTDDDTIETEASVAEVGIRSVDLKKLEAEIEELSGYIQWARSIGIDSKTKSLVKALEIGFASMAEMGAAQKVVIFTESRRTQVWLKNFLENNGHSGQVLTFNGTNADDASGKIYEDWVQSNRDSGRVSGSRQIDLRAAIIDRFKTQASILIATEAGAEGLNLQFCSAVINFDLP